MAPRNREGSKTLPQRSNGVQSGAHHAPADRCRKAKVRTGARREGAACPIYHISGLVPSSDRYRNARGAMETPIGAFQHGIGLKRLAGCGGRPMHRNQHAARHFSWRESNLRTDSSGVGAAKTYLPLVATGSRG